MLTLFKKTAPAQTAKSLTASSRRYVHSLTLDGVSDPFDADALWERARALLGDTGRLKSLLDRHAFKIGAEKHVFANVVVELPADEVEHDRRIASGERCKRLGDDLQRLHASSFGQRLAGTHAPRYAVRPGMNLAAGCVRVRFGHGVHVDDESDPVAWALQISTDGVIWKAIGDLRESQRLLILGGDASISSIAIQEWPFAAECSIVLVNEFGNPALDISAEPVRCLDIAWDEQLDCHVVSCRDSETRLYLRTTCLRKKKPAAHAKATMSLIASEPSEDVRLEPRLDDSHPEGADAASCTFIPEHSVAISDDATFVPTAEHQHHRISLVGIALQRVSAYRASGIDGLHFAFSANGKLTPTVQDGRSIGFGVDMHDKIYAETAAGQRDIGIGERLPLPDGGHIALETLPSLLEDRYLALCRLPAPICETVGVGARFAFGRGNPSVLSKLRVLSGQGFLVCQRGSDAERMGISRRHFLYEVAADGLVITPIEKNTLIHLDESLGFVEVMDGASSGTWLLPPGHHLLVAHYLMRYDV